jgi:hypothetical protein
MSMVQQLDKQIREYILQQEKIGGARRKQAPIDEVRQERAPSHRLAKNR